MKLLLDENLSRRLVPALQARFPGSSQVVLLGLERSTDVQLCDHAARAVFPGRRLMQAPTRVLLDTLKAEFSGPKCPAQNATEQQPGVHASTARRGRSHKLDASFGRRGNIMSSVNAEQIAEWNGAQGQRWAELQRETESIVMPFGEAALQCAAPQAGERVIDIGCGCGETSIELARRVGAAGSVLGVDVSQPMLEVARARAALAGWANLEFREADASEVELPGGTDLLFSRFGVMFFGQPVIALRHLRRSMRSQGRFVFVCWRAPRDNGWAMTPLVAARKAMGITPAPADPNAPGPFAFADGERLRGIVSEAGFEKIDLQRFDAPVRLGPTPRSAAQNSVRIGPASRFVREVGIENLPAIVDAIELAFTPLAAGDGSVSLAGSTWIVVASNP